MHEQDRIYEEEIYNIKKLEINIPNFLVPQFLGLLLSDQQKTP